MTPPVWTPKRGDKATYGTDTEVTIVGTTDTPGTFMVRYDRKDNFGERATFAADRLELSPHRRSAPAEYDPTPACIWCHLAWDETGDIKPEYRCPESPAAVAR